jgi:CubicO group peptidase (beta-lactamase class C family)
MPNHVLAYVTSDSVEITATGHRQKIGDELEMTPNTNFDLGSITKILCTTSILMKFVENNEVKLLDPVSRFLPNWNSSEKSTITIKNLLEHQSGLNEWRPLYISADSPKHIHELIAVDPLKYSPNSGRHYSDLGFITLGLLIETVSQASLEEVFSEIIAKPLALIATQFKKPADTNNVAATSIGDVIEKRMVETGSPYPVTELTTKFNEWRTNILVGEVNDGNSFHGFHGVAGHAGLFSNASDLATYLQEIISSMQGEGYFSQRVLNQFLTLSPDPMQAVGFRTWVISGQTFFGHTGFPGVAVAFTEEGTGLVYLSNRIHTEGEFPTTDSLWIPLLERENHP